MATCQSADADPGNYLLQMEAAAILYRAGRFAAALDYAQRARRLRPDSLDALLAVGVSQAELGQYEAAAATLAQAVERRPEDADIRTELAYVYLRREDFPAALAEAEQAHRLAPQAERTLEIIVQAALALGDKVRARKALKRLAAVNPGNPRLDELSRLAAAQTTTKGKPS
ncbi:MAG: tetratricopeptide repeat protein [Acidobacteriota bacterium]